MLPHVQLRLVELLGFVMEVELTEGENCGQQYDHRALHDWPWPVGRQSYLQDHVVTAVVALALFLLQSETHLLSLQHIQPNEEITINFHALFFGGRGSIAF